MSITIYAPDSEARPDRGSLAASRPSLAGLRIAVLDNGKPNASTVMTRAAHTLAERTGATVSVIVKKGPGGRSANAAIPCADDIFARVVAEADVVITGAADCGSCTAYSVYDAISFEKAGRPAVVVTTTKFEPIASTMAADFGMPDVRTLVLPHPLGGTERDVLWAWADASCDRLHALFVGASAGAETGSTAMPPAPSAEDPATSMAPMTVTTDAVLVALAEVQALVEADGSRFHLVDVSADGAVLLRLDIEDASCADCVMPADILGRMATQLITAAVPVVRSVEILDPRRA